jgi:hypothetical protein
MKQCTYSVISSLVTAQPSIRQTGKRQRYKFLSACRQSVLRISDPKPATKERDELKKKTFYPKNRQQALKNMGFGIRDPEKTFTTSRIRIRNTDPS